MRIRTNDDDGVEVQMAPLIDCMFLLLIFFLVATTLKEKQTQLDIQLPMADAAREVAKDPNMIVLGIDRLGRFYVDGTPVGREILRAEIERARDAGKVFRLDGDMETPYRYVIEVVNACNSRGVTDVDLHTRNPADDR